MTRNNGLLLVDKSSGMTSHDVVARVRKILGERRVGHAGTLDPLATGLLVLAVGPSTRLLRFAQAEVKHYSGTFKFGVATDSLDADGAVIAEGPVPQLSGAEVDEVVASMLGTQLQTPPMVSALKVGGRRLHELAREGVEVERQPREITVSEFRLEPTDDPALWNFDVVCSVGTYVRVLLSDMAVALGTVGHLTALRRLSSGIHRVDDAVSLEGLAQRVERGEDPLSPPADFVAGLERTVIDITQESKMRMGQRLELAEPFVGPEIAAFDARRNLLGILKRRGDTWQPELVLPASGEPARG
ncbi:MAG TPA: tRNA pseudouridine(55) synthase TruB [Acidimicrobiales bacterium]|nr:tRNA pseudouridine(55) synthase TruB [Acidimicrobiales bacterium]